MKIQSDIINKLRKILTLANDDAAHPGEAEAAMAKAREIAIAHNIELASVDMDSDDRAKSNINIEKDDSLRIRSKYQQPYHRWVFGILEVVFQVHVILNIYSSSSGKVVTRITLVGDAVDVAIAKEVFPFLEKIFPATLSRCVSEGKLRYCAADTNGCYRGIYAGIVETNRRAEAKATSTTNRYALVVRRKEEEISSAVAIWFPFLRKQRRTTQRKNPLAQMLGYAEGRKINLNQLG